VCFDPNRVVDSRTKIGFYREGFERLLETKDWNQVLNLVDRLNLGGAPTYAVAWVRVLEDLLRIRLPERAQALRIVGLELARILEHLVVLAQVCEALKLPEAQLFLNAHEKVTELVERFAGHRQGLGLINLGGVRQDLPHGWVVEYEVVSELVKKNLQLILKSLLSQRLFRGRLDGPALNAQTVLNWGISGPAMRAAGLNFDLRKSQPFYFYQDIDFDVPVGINGTAFDRFLIRYEELQQSFRIITQVIDNLPLGEFVLEDLNRSYPETWRRLRQLERIKDWHYVALESAHGEAGFSFLLDDELRPSNIKIKTPSFAIAQALKHFVSGLQEDQLRAGVLSLGIRRHELDR
jgi:NADH-quinone oxidoreductase subunit C/D